MIDITEAFVSAAAPNPDAVSNGRSLVLKKKFLTHHRSADDTLLFGECQGSGKVPYLCSADFSAADNPVYRCTCPSRQFPCKHSLGLLLAYAGGTSFTVADVPESIASKRVKAAARVEKKKEEAEKPRTVNKSALSKKIKAQLEGIDLLQKLTCDLVRLGIGNMNAKSAREIEAQAKQLGNAYLPGAQAALQRFTGLFQDDFGTERKGAQREEIYSEALDQLNRLHSLVKQGRAYLTRRLEDPELQPETTSPIAAWLGHAWQLRELKEAGLVQQEVDLLQLAFQSYDDAARREFVDVGTWMNLQTGQIQLTLNYRPYHASKFIKSDDSMDEIVHVAELCVYPGTVNPRIRWEQMTLRPRTKSDLKRVQAAAHRDFAQVIKDVKGDIKNPLAEKQPVYALQFQRIGRVGETLVIEDAQGARLQLTDFGAFAEPATCRVLSLLPPEYLESQTLIARFHHDLDSQVLAVKPLTIVTDKAVVRLAY